MRKLTVRLLLALAILLTLIAPAYAVGVRSGITQKVVPTETIDEDLVMAGQSVAIDGTVNGDVFAGGSSLVVNGRVNGDLFVSAGTAEIRGTVTGSVVFLGTEIVIKGRIERSLVTAASTVVIDQSGSIGHSWIGAADRSELLGTVERGVMAAGSQVVVNGRIGRDLQARVKLLEIGPTAAIAGPVTYASGTPAQIAPGAQTGQVTHHPVARQRIHWFFSPWMIALKFGGFLLAGLVLLTLFPGLRAAFPDLVLQRPGQTAVAGFLVLIALPVSALLLVVTVIGLPLGILLLAAYPILIYAGQILISWMTGRLLADRVPWLKGQGWVAAFILGALLTTVLTQLPIVGGILSIAAVILGLGGLWYLLQASSKQTGGYLS